MARNRKIVPVHSPDKWTGLASGWPSSLKDPLQQPMDSSQGSTEEYRSTREYTERRRIYYRNIFAVFSLLKIIYDKISAFLIPFSGVGRPKGTLNPFLTINLCVFNRFRCKKLKQKTERTWAKSIKGKDNKSE